MTTLTTFAAAETPAISPVIRPTTRPAATVTRDIGYRTEGAVADRRACVLDVYSPAAGPATATVVWFHGGGMTSGDKAEVAPLAELMAAAGVRVVAANYRLSPAVRYPAYVEDAAAAVAWTTGHAVETDAAGRRGPVLVGGYSAGGYLACELGADPRFLAAHGLTPAGLGGVMAVSPQVFTHYAVRAERGVADAVRTPLIDEAAPVYHASAVTPPLRLFCGDHDTETRREEIEYFVSVLKAKKHPDVTLTVVADRTHGSIFGRATEPDDVVGTGLIDFVLTHTGPRNVTTAVPPTSRPSPAERR